MSYLALIIQLSFFQYTSPKPLLEYLEGHEIEIVDNRSYVILSRHSCIYFNNNSVELIRKIQDCSNLVVITGDKKIKEKLENKTIVVFDDSYEFDNLPYNFYDVSLLKIWDNKVSMEVFGIKDFTKFHTRLKKTCAD